MKRIRINIVRKLIELNEKWFFDRKLIRWYRKHMNTPVRLAIDVGANRGQTIDIFLKLNPQCKIYAFEPNPVLYKELVKKYQSYPDVHLIQKGVSDTAGERVFYENVFHATSTFEELNMESKYLATKSRVLGVTPDSIIKDSYPVQIVTLSDFIRDHCPDEEIDILKIDTEGHEYYCLKGLFDPRHEYPCNIRYIQIEMHNDDMYKNARTIEEIESLLSDNGFRAFHKIGHGFGDFDDVIYGKR